MDKMLKVALMLTAIDRMSGVVGTATNKSLSELHKVEAAVKDISGGLLLMGTGKQGINLLKPTLDAFGEAQAAGNKLRVAMMKDGGIVDERSYQKMYTYAQNISDKWAGTTASYLDMMRVLKNNRVSEADILGGVGEGVERLATAFNMMPAAIGEFAAHMRNDMGVPANQMMEVMDLTFKTHLSGVGKTGEEAVYEMNQYFSKVGLGLVNLKVQGLEASKAMAILGAEFMARGISGESVGTNFRRILDGLRDPKKIKDANEEARKFGITLDFYDKAGKFKGVENFIVQLDKLKGLKTTSVAEILKPFSGRQGLSTDFLELMAQTGVHDYNKMGKHMFSHGSLVAASNMLMKGQEKQEQALRSSWENLKATYGATLSPMYTDMIGKLKRVMLGLRNFAIQHPGVIKIAAAFLTILSSMLMVSGAIKLVMGITRLAGLLPIVRFLGHSFGFLWFLFRQALPVIAMLGREMLVMGVRGAVAGLTFLAPWLPAIGIIAAIGLVLYGVYKLIVKHWGSMGNFWRALWGKITGIFKAFVGIAKAIFLNFTPVGIIYNHWGPISEWFSAKFEQVKTVFNNILNFVIKFGKNFFKAGWNIAKSIGEGIAHGAHMAVEKMKAMVQKLRNMLPFSPAKEGPLKDLHRVKIVETIADSFNMNALFGKMRSVTSTLANLRPAMVAAGASVAGGGGGDVHVHIQYAPQYHAGPGGDNRASWEQWAKDHVRYLTDIITKEVEKRNRRNF